MNEFLRILIISDLHFSGKKRKTVDNKSGLPVLEDFLSYDKTAEFFEQLDELCSKKGNYPNAVIVAGDLVDSGGKEPNEFEQAKLFLNELANRLKINTKKIFVVPGNHDVLWDKKLQQNEKFNNFIDATKDFSSPTITHSGISDLKFDLSDIVDGIKAKLLLMVSPTFSGYGSDNFGNIAKIIEDKFKGNIKKNLTEEDFKKVLNLFKKIIKDLPNHDHFYDIAAIGALQREMIHDDSNHNDYIKIAVMHHHLLPSSSIDVVQFESVLDSGKVLEKLIRSKYDIVVTGHKHYEKLVHYHLYDSCIDVFSSPCLFDYENSNSGGGFAFLDIYRNNSPYYAKISTFNTFQNGKRPISKKDLIRENRISKDTIRYCTSITPENQKVFLNKVAPYIVDALNWKDSYQFEKEFLPFFDDSFLFATSFFRDMAQKKIYIKSPVEGEGWERFIKTINKVCAMRGKPEDNQIRLVSASDISYWSDAIDKPNSDAHKYSLALQFFKGKKIRILILPKSTIIQEKEEVKRIVSYMNSMEFDVHIVEANDADFMIEKDFSIISNICVSRWDALANGNRELIENFDREYISRKILDWNNLINKPFIKL